MKYSYRALIVACIFIAPSCSEDNTAKKKKSANTSNQNGQYQQNNQQYQNGNQYGNQIGNQQQQQNIGGDITYGSEDTCGAKTFSKSLSGSVEKSLTIVVPINISGDGSLKVENTATELGLDVGVSNLQVSVPLIKPQVQSELNKATGKRSLIKVTDSEREALKTSGDAWASTNCLIGFAKRHRFPYQGKTVTVEFTPALPFAPFPDKVNSDLEQAVGSGLNFANITGKIVSVEGGSLQGFNIGDEYPGSVRVSRSGSTYKSEFNFGGFSPLEKLGLFTSAAYTYSSGDISKVDVKVPILNGSDSIEIEFN